MLGIDNPFLEWLQSQGKIGLKIFIIVLHIAETSGQSRLDGPVSFLSVYVCLWGRFFFNRNLGVI